jgi:hypothetical protein
VLGEVRRNPPVTIEDWPEPDDEPDIGEDDEPNNNEPVDRADRDPDYVEQHEPLRFHPDDEPGQPNAAVLAWMDLNLGDFADQQWVDMCKLFYFSLFNFLIYHLGSNR